MELAVSGQAPQRCLQPDKRRKRALWEAIRPAIVHDSIHRTSSGFRSLSVVVVEDNPDRPHIR